MSALKEGQKSVRVVLTNDLYERLKLECPEHGDLSRLIRLLLRKHMNSVEQLQKDAEAFKQC